MAFWLQMVLFLIILLHLFYSGTAFQAVKKDEVFLYEIGGNIGKYIYSLGLILL